MKRASRNPEVVEVDSVGEEALEAGVLAAVDAEALSYPRSGLPSCFCGIYLHRSNT